MGVTIHMINSFIYHKHSKLLIYILLALIILSSLTLYSTFSLTNTIDELAIPRFLTSNYQSDFLNIDQISRNKINLDITYRIIITFGLILLLTYNLIQKFKHNTYENSHSSRLLIRLHRLLIPRKNMSKYKASLILTFYFYSNC